MPRQLSGGAVSIIPRRLKLSPNRTPSRKRQRINHTNTSHQYPHPVIGRATVAEICRQTALSQLPLAASSIYLKSAVVMEKNSTQKLHTDSIQAEHHILSSATRSRRTSGQFHHGSVIAPSIPYQSSVKMTQKQRQELLQGQKSTSHGSTQPNQPGINPDDDLRSRNGDNTQFPQNLANSTNYPNFGIFGTSDLASPSANQTLNPSFILNDLHRQIVLQQQHIAYLQRSQQDRSLSSNKSDNNISSSRNQYNQPGALDQTTQTRDHFDHHDHFDSSIDSELSLARQTDLFDLDAFDQHFQHFDADSYSELHHLQQHQQHQQHQQQSHTTNSITANDTGEFNFNFDNDPSMNSTIHTNAYNADSFNEVFNANHDIFGEFSFAMDNHIEEDDLFDSSLDLTLLQQDHPSFMSALSKFNLGGMSGDFLMHPELIQESLLRPLPATLLSADQDDQDDPFLRTNEGDGIHKELEQTKTIKHSKKGPKKGQSDVIQPSHVLSKDHHNKHLVIRDASLIMDPEQAQSHIETQKEYEANFVTIQLAEEDLYNPRFSELDQLYHSLHGEFTLHNFYLPAAYQPCTMSLCETSLTSPSIHPTSLEAVGFDGFDGFDDVDNNGMGVEQRTQKTDKKRKRGKDLYESTSLSMAGDFVDQNDYSSSIYDETSRFHAIGPGLRNHLYRPQKQHFGDLLGLYPLQTTLQALYMMELPTSFTTPSTIAPAFLKRPLSLQQLFTNHHNSTYLTRSSLFTQQPNQISTCTNTFHLPAPFSTMQSFYASRLIELDRFEARQDQWDDHSPEFYNCIDTSVTNPNTNPENCFDAVQEALVATAKENHDGTLLMKLGKLIYNCNYNDDDVDKNDSDSHGGYTAMRFMTDLPMTGTCAAQKSKKITKSNKSLSSSPQTALSARSPCNPYDPPVLGPNSALNFTHCDRLHLFHKLSTHLFPSYEYFNTTELHHFQPTSLHWLTFQAMTVIPNYFATMPNLTQHLSPPQFSPHTPTLSRLQGLIRLIRQQIEQHTHISPSTSKSTYNGESNLNSSPSTPSQYTSDKCTEQLNTTSDIESILRNNAYERILSHLYLSRHLSDPFNLSGTIYNELLPYYEHPELSAGLIDPNEALSSDPGHLLNQPASHDHDEFDFNELGQMNGIDMNFDEYQDQTPDAALLLPSDDNNLEHQLSTITTADSLTTYPRSDLPATPSHLIGNGNSVGHLSTEQITTLFDAFDNNHREIGHILYRLREEFLLTQQHHHQNQLPTQFESTSPNSNATSIFIPLTTLLSAYSPTMSLFLIAKSAAATVFVSLLGLNRAKVVNLTQHKAFDDIQISFGPLWESFTEIVLLRDGNQPSSRGQSQGPSFISLAAQSLREVSTPDPPGSLFSTPRSISSIVLSPTQTSVHSFGSGSYHDVLIHDSDEEFDF